MKFTKGDKVAFKKNAEVMVDGKDITKATGTVVKVFEGFPVVLVDFDGDVIKVPAFALEIVKVENEDQKIKSDEITLTREKWNEYGVKFTSLKFIEDLFEGEEISEEAVISFASAAAIIFDNLGNMLFGESAEND